MITRGFPRGSPWEPMEETLDNPPGYFPVPTPLQGSPWVAPEVSQGVSPGVAPGVLWPPWGIRWFPHPGIPREIPWYAPGSPPGYPLR